MSGEGKDEIQYEFEVSDKVVKGGKVKVILYYQSIPPFYLKQRFETAKGVNGQRLYYLASKLNTKGTPVEGWKLATDTAERTIN